MTHGVTLCNQIVVKILKNSDRHETTFPIFGKVNWYGKNKKFDIPTMAFRARPRSRSKGGPNFFLTPMCSEYHKISFSAKKYFWDFKAIMTPGTYSLTPKKFLPANTQNDPK